MIPLTIACGPRPEQLIPIVIFIVVLPSIIIEAILLKNILKKKWRESFIFSSIANIASLIAGVIYGFILASLENFLVEIFIICCFLTIPILVIWIEIVLGRKYWKDISIKRLSRAIIIVNLVTIVIVFILGALLPPTCGVRKKARRISCSSNLKQIGLSLKQYAMDYNDFFPNEGWEQLRSNDYLTAYGVYNCPSTVTPKGKDNEKLTYDMVDYIYRKGLKDNSDSKIPLAWDKPENHEDYGNVLFVDGHVRGFKGADWMEQAGIKKVENSSR